ncbi:DUF92 domain-containing protein [Bacillus coahuilensis]|uniref:DUF92 domain-containing protein n=1 Tax=Bacillus coahuilensis TaxID=408580 RepID=UPI0009E6CF12|nr:DUF92 domain-containing protein [Bacillus coahuilensis]
MHKDYIIILLLLVGCVMGNRFHLLSSWGAFLAGGMGILFYEAFQLNGLVIVAMFFATSSLFSIIGRNRKSMMNEKLVKSSKRDAEQVIANGGPAVLFTVMYIFDPSQLWFIGFVGSIAASTSDTWASELGTLSSKSPISLRNFKRVEKGSSGAITIWGTAVSFVHALLLLGYLRRIQWLWGLLIAGVIGSLVDSMIGAFVQEEFECPSCYSRTEKKMHCGFTTKKVKGLKGVNNEVVNFLASLSGGLVAVSIELSLL